MLSCALKMFLLLLGAALLGYLLSWLLNRLRQSKLERDIADQKIAYGKLKTDHDMYVANLNILQNKFSHSEEHANNLGLQLSDATGKLNSLKGDFGLLLNEKNRLSTSLDEQKAQTAADLSAAQRNYQELQVKYKNDLDTLNAKFGALNDEKDQIVVLAAKERDTLNRQVMALDADKLNLSASVNQLRADLDKATAAQKKLQGDYDTLNLSFGSKTNQIAALEEDKTGLLAKIAAIGISVEALTSEKNSVQAQHDNLLANYSTVKANIDALNTQLLGLAEQKDTLQVQYNALLADHYDDNNKINVLNAQLLGLAEQKDTLQVQYNALLADHYDDNNKINVLNAQLLGLAEQKDTLQVQYNALLADHYNDNNKINALTARLTELSEQNEVVPPVTEVAVLVEDPVAPPTELQGGGEEEEVLNRIRQKASLIDFGRIGFAAADERDKLTLLKGVGDFIEKKLHALGIYTFRQIANFTPEDEETVNEAIEFFAGRIRRERWKEQSADLVTLRNNGISLTETSEDELTLSRIRLKADRINFERIGRALPEQADDLRIIKGIGDFIQLKLNTLGIYTFAQMTNLNENDRELVANCIEVPAGRIRDWALQAAELMK